MGNVDLRLAYMDRTGVDVQVLHNTIFIESVTDRPGGRSGVVQELEPLARRYLAQVEQAPALVLHGADFEHVRRSRSDTLWQRKRRLRRAYAPRRGASFALRPLFLPDLRRSQPARYGDRDSYRQWQQMAQRSLRSSGQGRRDVASFSHAHGGVLQRYSFERITRGCFPSCAGDSSRPARSGCLGCCMKRRIDSEPWGANGRTIVAREYGMFVTCENSDDLPYIVQQGGEDCLVIGTDYGHTDTSSDIDAIKIFRDRTDLAPKREGKNPRATTRAPSTVCELVRHGGT